jgi:multidrug efflux system outer membrane protein
VAGPLFQGGRLYETYRQRQAFWDESIAQFRGIVIQAFREVADALAAESRLGRQRGALARQVQALDDAVQLSLLRYDRGYAFYFEVLDAQQQLYPAEYALAQTERDQLLAVVDLYKALGGGWQTADQTAQGSSG